MKNLLVMGPPGSGKDTQIIEILKYLHFELISSGDLVRELAKKDLACRKIMSEGGLVPDDILLAEIEKRVDMIDPHRGIIFDGFPRTLHQAEVLNELLLHHSRTVDRVIYIALEEDAIVDRLTRRKICSICGQNIMPGVEKCPECGGRPVRRPDDEPAVVIKRVQTFLENTLPLINYYRNKDILVEIDGDQSIVAVAKDVKEKLSDVIS